MIQGDGLATIVVRRVPHATTTNPVSPAPQPQQLNQTLTFLLSRTVDFLADSG